MTTTFFARQLVLPNHEPERGEGRGLVLDQASVVDSEDTSTAHVPPRDRLLAYLATFRRVDADSVF